MKGCFCGNKDVSEGRVAGVDISSIEALGFPNVQTFQKSIADKEAFLKIVHETKIEQKQFAVQDFELIQSMLGRPPVYKTIFKVQLR